MNTGLTCDVCQCKIGLYDGKVRCEYSLFCSDECHTKSHEDCFEEDNEEEII